MFSCNVCGFILTNHFKGLKNQLGLSRLAWVDSDLTLSELGAMGLRHDSAEKYKNIEKSFPAMAWPGSLPLLSLILHGTLVYNMKSLEMDAKTLKLLSNAREVVKKASMFMTKLSCSTVTSYVSDKD